MQDALLITTAAAVAVARAVETVAGCDAAIKWVNDVYCNGKKICGILTEASTDFESGSLAYAILGIGMNVADPAGGFPAELSQVAASLFGRGTYSSEARSRLAAEVCKAFCALYSRLPEKAFMEEYRQRSFVIGSEVDVISRCKPVPRVCSILTTMQISLCSSQMGRYGHFLPGKSG